MTYEAIVVRVNVVPHPNADKLALGLVQGTSVVIDKSVKDGELMVYFPTDGQLSEEFAKANDLIARKDENGNRAGGFFSSNRKVRSQKFRGQKSDGFLAPLSYFASFGDSSELTEGHSFDTFNGIPICNKYYTPATLKAMARNKEGKPGIRRQIQSFAKHVDTEQFYKECNYIPVNSTIWITEKLHGTSGRTGNVWVEETLPKKWYHKFGLKPKTTKGYQIVNGTRNTILGKTDKSFYSNEDFRSMAIKGWSERLYEGEVVYYEIVGFTTNKSPIMSPASLKDLKDKELTKKFGDVMHYSYGCNPDGYIKLDAAALYPGVDSSNIANAKMVDKPQFDIYVYRITRTDKLGNAIEYSWPQVKHRCDQLGIKHVPETDSAPFVLNNETLSIKEFGATLYTLVDLVEDRIEGSSMLDQTHIREGVVLRVEPPFGRPYFLKAKSFTFKLCEGMVKEDENSVDLEEIS